MGLAARVMVIEQRTALRESICESLRELATVSWVLSKATATGATSMARTHALDLVVLGQGARSDEVARSLTEARPGALLVRTLSNGSSGMREVLTGTGGTAVEFVIEPANDVAVSAWCERQLRPILERLIASWDPVPRGRPLPPAEGPEVILMGASTGGPAAVLEFLANLGPTGCPPVVLVQHMSPSVIAVFCDHLERSLEWRVLHVTDEQPLAPRTVYVAGADHHLEVVRRASDLWCVPKTGAPVRGCIPSVDELFRSAARSVGQRCVAVVLTGIGRDGEEGSRALHQEGAVVLAQDASSSVVWGMPGAVARAGYATEVLPLDELSAYVRGCLTSPMSKPSANGSEPHLAG